jgi:hypothetical protein
VGCSAVPARRGCSVIAFAARLRIPILIVDLFVGIPPIKEFVDTDIVLRMTAPIALVPR